MILKPHTWIELNKKSIKHNLKEYKNFIKNGFFAPVIKGNAYGHGLLEIGRICQESSHVDYLCVTSLSEALNLRNAKIKKPILVLSCIDDNPEYALEKNIDITIFNEQTAQLLNNCARKKNKKLSIHIKVDTGLGRFGFNPENTIQLIKQIRNNFKFLIIKGIYTHFSQSHISDQNFTNLQIKKFKTILQQLKKERIKIDLIHACNSAATVKLNKPLGNFFRVGIGIYGYWSSNYIKQIMQKKLPSFILKPILTWKTQILEIKTIPKNSPIGYDRTFITNKKTKIAILPVGYVDGYSKKLEKNGHVFINKKLAPIIGKIGMNSIIIDITKIPNIKIGDEAILVGNYPGIEANKLAALFGGNTREITTCISPTIKRIMV